MMQPLMPTADDLMPYLRRIDEAKVYSNFGPLHSELISRLSSYFVVEHDQIVLMSNATIALQAAIEISTEKGSKIELPAWTFTATPSAAISAGTKPFFLDIDNEWRAIPRLDSSCFLDVLPFGSGLRSIECVRKNTIIDGAASFDALKGCGPSLQQNVILVISMHSTKLLGAGEGAVLITKNMNYAQILKSWSNFGFSPSSRLSDFKGTNSKLSEYAAAVALASLDRWPETRSHLMRIKDKAFQISKDFNLKLAPPMIGNYITPYWLVEFESGTEKNRMVQILREDNIESREWWAKGCHKMPAYLEYVDGELRNTDLVAARSLGLPFHAFLTDRDFEKLEIAFRKL